MGKSYVCFGSKAGILHEDAELARCPIPPSRYSPLSTKGGHRARHRHVATGRKSSLRLSAQCRALIALIAITAAIPADLLGAPATETFPSVDSNLLARCRAQITAECLADIAWNISQGERRAFNLGQLARAFARLGQWRRVEDLLARLPKDNTASKVSDDLAVKYVNAERLAASLAADKLDALPPVKDPVILSVAAARLLGYLPRENVVASDRRGKRLNEGLWKNILPASRRSKLALLEQWDGVFDESPTYLQVSLANNYLLLGDVHHAQRLATRIQPKRTDIGRDVVELWLRLGEPKRALEVIDVFEPRYRGLYKTMVAKSLGARGELDKAGKLALDAADDSFTANDFGGVLTTVELLAEMKAVDVAKQITLKAERLSETKGPFRPFDVSTVGEMYGWIGDSRACLRLQAKALGVQPQSGKVIAWGLVSGPIGYGTGGPFDLGPELKQNVASRSLRCGDRGALDSIDNRWLARNYCDYRERGLVSPRDLEKRSDNDEAPRSLLWDAAAECHFEHQENEIASSFLHRLLIEQTKPSANFHTARSASELACVFGPPTVCRGSLQIAGQVLINAVAERQLSPQHVVEFAAAWQNRAAR